MVPPAVVIQSALSGCRRTVIGSCPLPNAHSRRGWRTRGGSRRCARGEEEDCDTGEGGIDEVGFHGFQVFGWFTGRGLTVVMSFVYRTLGQYTSRVSSDRMQAGGPFSSRLHSYQYATCFR